MRWESTQRHMGALYERISENYRASYGGEVEVGADTRAFRRFRATRDGTIHEDPVVSAGLQAAVTAVVAAIAVTISKLLSSKKFYH
ncbi:uncharacterized protein BDR25DRAFT_390762 [Lindgomyces ingoldianus]|uniref:Uncharacterized protein n=1 Tax=Lindgomyces ingoldianus TaxID=673940 RepID=A0ACB6RDB4_9PLEO|nr:uncharacterized protein BDR25DRAFT_390762 [Lindgomyces ingoldianus]KAF2477181.1 hypothetical protein BDR25DRAFT_390762 [Lindgomyces ingoldianus]